MNVLAPTSVETIARGLRSKATRLVCATGGRWSLEMTNGASHRVEVRLDEDWLQFTDREEEAIVTATPEALWRAANRNTGLPPETRLVLSPARRMELRSDLLLTDELDTEQRIRGVVDAFERVWRTEPHPTAELAAECSGELERLCEETGWRSVRRSSGRLTVALEPTPALQATVTADGGGVRLSSEVVDLSSSSSHCRFAAAALALEITSSLRLVRASTDADSTKLFVEVLWPEMPTGAELDAGFASLSAAGRIAGESFTALQIEALAQDYLIVRGWSADGSKTNQERTNP